MTEPITIRGVTVHRGDCLDVMRTLAPASIDAVVTDPPYGLAFMGKHWDHNVPGVDYWRECLRLLKPGGYLLAASGSRTYHRLASAVEDAGFVIRDQIMWLYGQGFPKGKNQLKPAHEPIVMARKPAKGAVRALNIDACRIGVDWAADPNRRGWQGGNSHAMSTINFGPSGKQRVSQPHNEGRWPANVIHDGSDEVMAAFAAFGESTSSQGPFHHSAAAHNTTNSMGKSAADWVTSGYADRGTAARFFYCAKAARAERNGSKHPTVKPLALMRYLCRLVTPPGGVVLDPFAGTGTTGEAAALEGMRAVLIENEPEYVADIVKRLDRDRQQQLLTG